MICCLGVRFSNVVPNRIMGDWYRGGGSCSKLCIVGRVVVQPHAPAAAQPHDESVSALASGRHRRGQVHQGVSRC